MDERNIFLLKNVFIQLIVIHRTIYHAQNYVS